jgi:hypothetical protein
VRGAALFPGAGSDANQPALVAIAASLAPLPVDRVDFPYRRAGRRAPDRAPVLLEAVRVAVADLAERLGTTPDHLVLGGRSMGGRMCSMAVAGDEDIPGLATAGLVLVAYPLHPPGKPDRLRVDHLPRLNVPCLFVQGTRDPFGGPDELTPWTAAIPGPVTHHWIDGGRHDLKGADDEVASVVAAWVRGLG